MKALADCRLYTFVDTAYLRERDPALVARQLCDGGSDVIQLRAKNASLDQTRDMARAILPVTSAAGVRLVINDLLELAHEVGADLCHLGQEDFFGRGYCHVQELPATGSKLQIGLSTHAPDQCRRAVEAGADYVAVGPVYETGTKPGVKPVTLDYVRWAAANISIPWFAIGGINLNRLDEVLEAGARRVCVVSAILNAPDVAAECRRFKERLCQC